MYIQTTNNDNLTIHKKPKSKHCVLMDYKMYVTHVTLTIIRNLLNVVSIDTTFNKMGLGIMMEMNIFTKNSTNIKGPEKKTNLI